MIETLNTTPETPRETVPARPPYAEPSPEGWPGDKATLKAKRSYWKLVTEWRARVVAAWAATPIQKIARLEVEQLVIRPHGATGSIEIGARACGRTLDGIGDPAIIFMDANGHRRLEINCSAADSTGIVFFGPTGDEDTHPFMRAYIGLSGDEVTFYGTDSAGNTVFRFSADGRMPLSDSYCQPAEGDTPEQAADKAESRARVARLNARTARERREARAYRRARGVD